MMLSSFSGDFNRQIEEMSKKFLRNQQAELEAMQQSFASVTPKCANCGVPIVKDEEVCGEHCARVFYRY